MNRKYLKVCTSSTFLLKCCCDDVQSHECFRLRCQIVTLSATRICFSFFQPMLYWQDSPTYYACKIQCKEKMKNILLHISHATNVRQKMWYFKSLPFLSQFPITLLAPIALPQKCECKIFSFGIAEAMIRQLWQEHGVLLD